MVVAEDVKQSMDEEEGELPFQRVSEFLCLPSGDRRGNRNRPKVRHRQIAVRLVPILQVGKGQDIRRSVDLSIGSVQFALFLVRDEGKADFACSEAFEVLKDVVEIGNKEKLIPSWWITKDGTDVTDDFIDYVKPLIEGECDIKYQDGLPLYVHRSRASM